MEHQGRLLNTVLVLLLLAGAIGYAPRSWPEESSRSEPKSPHHFTEAVWARAVLSKADLRVTGSIGSALVAEVNGVSVFFWALERPAKAEGRDTLLSQQGYELWRSTKGVEIYSDGLHLTWGTDRVYVWLQARPPSTLRDVDNKTIEAVVQASIRPPSKAALP